MSSMQEITTLIRSFRELTGVGVCFYDTENFFRFRQTGEKEYKGHYCEFCSCARLLAGGRVACDKSDRDEAMELAKAYRTPFFHRCHMGLCELVVPVIREERLLGIIFLGQCRIAGEDLSEDIATAAKALGGEGEQFVELYRRLPVMKREDLTVMGDLFHLYFSRIGDSVSLFDKEGTPVEEERGSLAGRIASYIEVRYRYELSPRSISERFFVNPSHMARLFKQEKGMSVTEYIRRIRHQNACRLLRNSHVPVGSIALNVGYTDTGYFCRVFKRIEGMTPMQYREENQKKEKKTAF